MTSTRPSGPTFADWALFGISIVFTLAGVAMLFSEPRTAAGVLGMFGVCALMFGQRILRKRRRRRFSATSVAVAGGVKLAGSNRGLGLATAFFLFCGLVPFLIPQAPLLVFVAGVLAFGFVAVALFLVVTGRLSRRFIRFDPPGLTINEVKYEYLVPWDAIARIGELELFNHASVGIAVTDPDAIQVTPESARAAVLTGLANNRGLSGFDVVIMALHYDVPAEALGAAIHNYARNADARGELVAKPAIS